MRAGWRCATLSPVTNQATNQHGVDDLLRAFRNILRGEAASGYADRKVLGGLDGFLATLRAAAASAPAVAALQREGLLAVGYAELPPEKRKQWADETGRILDLRLSAPAREPAASPVPPAVKPRAKRPPTPIALDSPIEALKSVTRPSATKLRGMGVQTVRDLVFLFPTRHIDYSALRRIAEVVEGEELTVLGALWEAKEIQMGANRRVRATAAVIGDETGNLRLVWFQQPWVAANLRRAASRAAAGAEHMRFSVSGKVSVFNGRRQMDNPEWEAVDDPETSELVNTGRLLPVYPSTKELYQKTLRRIVRDALNAVSVDGQLAVDDPLPEGLAEKLGLWRLPRAVAQAHYPDSLAAFEEARRRLAFDEFFVLQLAVAARRSRPASETPGIVLAPMPEPVQAFIRSLPFELTAGQRGGLDDAMADVAGGARPMSRLLQGDVGSGKTVVALAMLLTAVAAGHQGAIMAPTEVLAEQHFLSVRRLLSAAPQPVWEQDWFSIYLDGHRRPISIGLLTGSTRAAPRREILRMAVEGTLDILIGTHALIQSGVEMPDLALAVVDEQHRFGVLQRAAIRKQSAPHLLLMSATPIPRTLALTLYGDLDVSVMPDLPAGRREITTRIVPPARAGDAERFLVQQAAEGRQSFVVCPLIDESEAVLAKAATVEYDRLRSTVLSGLRVGLLHGRMALGEKQAVMDEFRAGALDVLVTTPVIEVGVDVPNATVMLIEGADRFGLAQLHQLRGRVGRGEHQSYCFLVAESSSDEAMKRMEALARTNDGFEIAEADLRLRGPGDFFGTRQSGLPTLRMARLDDRDLLAQARAEAGPLLQADPGLRQHEGLASAVARYTAAVSGEDGVS